MAMAKRWLMIGPLLFASGAPGCGRTDLTLGADAGIDVLPGPPSLADAEIAPDLAVPLGPDLAPDLRSLTCGNGRLDFGEECDDGNTLPADGCDGSCILECNWSDCPKPPFTITVVCGDGMLNSPEGCDDANVSVGDGCSGNCTVEPGFRCDVPGQRCTPICGDGILAGPEECDQGLAENTAVYGDHAGCRINCTLPHYCGDWYVDADAGEDCDLGDRNGTGSYCAPNCHIWMP
jgi:cysteine-rich repeat protein